MIKKVSKGSKIVGTIDIITAIILISFFIILFLENKIRLDHIGDNINTTMGLIVLLIGILKLIGVLLIWSKKNMGKYLYIIGTIGFIFILYSITKDFNILIYKEMLPASLLYLAIILQTWFINIMFKAIVNTQEKI